MEGSEGGNKNQLGRGSLNSLKRFIDAESREGRDGPARIICQKPTISRTQDLSQTCALCAVEVN